MGDHTECFQVDFDPEVVTYDDLLGLFWSSHDPTRGAHKAQYESLILSHDAHQVETARESASRLTKILGTRVATRIEPLDRFYLAEDYHQKYYLQNEDRVMADFRAMYPNTRDFIDSTAAARVNGYLYGAGSCARLHPELSALGLSTEAGDRLHAKCR
jgi:peptide methionine sulfoxide reductase MsrA